MTLREMIDLCEANPEHIPENARRFVDKLIYLRNELGDNQFILPRQRSYLIFLCSQIPKPVEKMEKPKSNLQRLKEKRTKLLRSIAVARRRQCKEEQTERLARGTLKHGGLEMEGPTALMVHQKSANRQNMKRSKVKSHINRKRGGGKA